MSFQVSFYVPDNFFIYNLNNQHTDNTEFCIFYSVSFSSLCLFLSFFLSSLIFPHIILQSLVASVTSFYFITRLAEGNQASSLLRKLCSILSSPIPGTVAEKPLYSLQWHFWQSNVPQSVGTVGVMNGNAGFFFREFFH